jgi:TetR/AcrR family transcriptional regulator, regulator of cefoperazone and chloramphenicol sensitivity
VTGPVSQRDQLAGELPSTEQLCAAAMNCFAANGIEAGSLREVAKIAGVSVGFVQNRFGSKGALVEAVNQQLVSIITEAATPSTPGPDLAAEWSQRAMVLIAEHPDAIDYLGQLMLGDHPTGRAIFDQLVAIATAQCREARAQRTIGADDHESTWDALNPLILILGTLILRSHIERQLPESIGSPHQRRRWESALDYLMECPYRDRQTTSGQRGHSSTHSDNPVSQ